MNRFSDFSQEYDRVLSKHSGTTVFFDKRGNFMRLDLAKDGHKFKVSDFFITTSKLNVARGIHCFDLTQPTTRIVKCVSGSVRDFLIDLRPGSETLGLFVENHLTGSDDTFIFIPPGIGHGIISLSDEARMLYLTDCLTRKEDEFGVRLDSIGAVVPSDVVISESDSALQTLDQYISSLA